MSNDVVFIKANEWLTDENFILPLINNMQNASGILVFSLIGTRSDDAPILVLEKFLFEKFNIISTVQKYHWNEGKVEKMLQVQNKMIDNESM